MVPVGPMPFGHLVRYRLRLARLLVLCHVLGHKEDVHSSGFGFGRMDLFCKRCEHLIRSVPLAEMTDDMREAVIRMGGASLLMGD